MTTSHILSAVDPTTGLNGNVPAGGGGAGGAAGGSPSPQHGVAHNGHAHGLGGVGGAAVAMASGGAVGGHRIVGGAGSPNELDRNLRVSLDDRELWLRFQNLTNEMIVTKNGRWVVAGGAAGAASLVGALRLRLLLLLAVERVKWKLT